MTTTPDLPPRMRHLAEDHHHRPIPWFVHREEDGTPDFRIVRTGGVEDALRFGLCWICGQRRGRHAAFVIGPMCAVNRVSPEPPSHRECALYAAQACPFLANPSMRRRETDLPEDRVDPAGQMIRRNPGVALVWSSRTWAQFPIPAQHGGGALFDVGDPSEVSWWAHGRPATRTEVVAAIDSGLPLLLEQVETDRDPQAARAEFDRCHARAMELVPA